jgi:hypothetical protein
MGLLKRFGQRKREQEKFTNITSLLFLPQEKYAKLGTPKQFLPYTIEPVKMIYTRGPAEVDFILETFQITMSFPREMSADYNSFRETLYIY